MSFFKELKRRNVFKVGIAYAVTTWILLQLTDVVSEILVLPEWAPKLILLILVVGFIPALILAWAFEMTPEGIKLEKEVARQRSITPRTGRKLDMAIIVLMGLALAYFIWESRFEQKTEDFESAEAAALIKPEVVEVPYVPVELPLEGIDKNSIAVLPFANRSADAADMYFTDGIHDDLLTQLSRIEAFSVISRTSVMEYRDTTKNLRQIASELSVANVMEGSVQRSGDRVRINVQLIDAYTDEHLWAEIYDREFTTTNLFDIQSEIAQAIATALEATLTDSELASVSAVPTDNVAAYDLYLQAKRFGYAETLVGYQAALDLFKEAVALDPEFKQAWVGLARTHISNYWLYGGDPVDRDRARGAIDRAKAIDPDFSELFMAEGFYWYWGHLDYERALYNLGKAIEMTPGNNEAYMWQAWVSRRAGQWEKAIESMHQSLKLDPRVHFNWVELAGTYVFLHRFENARNAFAQAREIEPDNYREKTGMSGLVLMEFGDVESAVRMTIGAQHTNEPDFFDAYLLARIYAGRYEEALEATSTMSDKMEIRLGLITLNEDWAAQILYFMGRIDEAKDAVRAAQFRLKGLRAQDNVRAYAVDLAEARMSAILGSDPEVIKGLVQNSMESMPEDEVIVFSFKLEYARTYAIAGLVEESIEILEPLLSAPSETTIHTVDLDPAFDGIRDNVEFAAMMDRHR
jgi:TolB-like protein